MSATSADGGCATLRGLVTCQACGLLCRCRGTPDTLCCPRCRARLHARKPNSVSRTWAFVIAAYILYIPANTLPILETRSLFDVHSNTIMSGVILFWNSGSWFVAALIFFASIVVPLTKLIALTLLLVSVQRRMDWQPRQRTRLYRLVDAIGRWSMLDIYVAALSVALVQVESFASMRAGLGAAAFGAVVVLTMLAAHSFDPRLIWDERGS
ncbi:paraquat-inducible protein A [Noviherbaspirillum sp. UKPF54]|uniref:paraquat-inducible protein A n=1 Tax=Noviherbaspirillum sp. UKPF54 TaxID=2601898 RepID=UPI0011B1A2E2|nr:paraquat-inducible protein A [Noviherbaspirillum sp. UKPF54]QDZ30083.1 paraquat-inducible membrane protein A [Noviherbaspirillum sp. UKPF54]